MEVKVDFFFLACNLVETPVIHEECAQVTIMTDLEMVENPSDQYIQDDSFRSTRSSLAASREKATEGVPAV